MARTHETGLDGCNGAMVLSCRWALKPWPNPAVNLEMDRNGQCVLPRPRLYTLYMITMTKLRSRSHESHNHLTIIYDLGESHVNFMWISCESHEHLFRRSKACAPMSLRRRFGISYPGPSRCSCDALAYALASSHVAVGSRESSWIRVLRAFGRSIRSIACCAAPWISCTASADCSAAAVWAKWSSKAFKSLRKLEGHLWRRRDWVTNSTAATSGQVAIVKDPQNAEVASQGMSRILKIRVKGNGCNMLIRCNHPVWQVPPTISFIS